MPKPSLSQLTGVYLRIGNLTFGGGDPTMMALRTELVENRGWLAPLRFGLVYALARVTPGTNVLAFCAGTAWEILGWRGAMMAVLVATVPSAVLVVMLTAGYDSLRTYPRAMAAIGGILAAAVGMMMTGAWQLLSRHLTSGDAGRALRALAVAAVALLLASQLRLTPISVLGLAAAVGLLWPAPAKA
jgi:chromate transporter